MDGEIMDGQKDGNDGEKQKKNAKIKRGVLIGLLVFAGAALLVAFPLIVIARGCGLF